MIGFLTPVLCVTLIRYTGPTPASAAPSTGAAEPAPTLEIPSARPAELTADQASAARRFEQLSRMGPARTPFPINPSDDQTDPPDAETPGSEYPGQAPDAPEIEPPPVRFTSIMSQPNLALAVVDGRLCGIGSPVTPDWRLVQIDPARRVVTVRHRTGHEVDLALPTP